MTAQRWLVLGLGNPDDRYGGTRHNVGAACVEHLADDLGVRLTRHRSGAALADTFSPVARVPMTLGRPRGYMNTSGGPAQKALAFYKLPLERLVVVHDDMDLPLGTVRLKLGGGTGGHNGLRDIRQRCGGAGFHRVRLGVGRPARSGGAVGHVLAGFGRDEQDTVRELLDDGAGAVLALVEDGLGPAQNRYHADRSG